MIWCVKEACVFINQHVYGPSPRVLYYYGEVSVLKPLCEDATYLISVENYSK